MKPVLPISAHRVCRRARRRSVGRATSVPPSFSRTTDGTVLLEVVLALILFAAAAAVASNALNAAIRSGERLKLQAHAADLAVSVVSELQLGIRSPAVLGPAPFAAPFTNWTWQLQMAPGDGPEISVEVVVRHDDPEYVHRLGQIVTLPSKIVPGAADETQEAPP